jgi:hypothetical protein
MIYKKKSRIRYFLEGFAYVFDLFGVLGPDVPDLSEDGFEKDMKAIASDWQTVGDDIRRAMKHYS